ncbi:MAG: hypothetical protein QHH43_08225 [Candidatus Saccharicenans sp.]|nr:hypothetical protein [Candidatus Saccharicenans sp.]MDH7575726.1 hypothetical protein [Candidatus Saccharicenans sp.]
MENLPDNGAGGFILAGLAGIRSDVKKVDKNPYKSGSPGRILATAKEIGRPAKIFYGVLLSYKK